MGYIYWIASYPKSGNTWMRAFLTSMVTGGTTNDLTQLGAIAPDENNGRYFAPFLGKPINQASHAEIAAVRPMAHRAMAAAANGFLFLKSHAMLAKHLGTPTITAEVTAGAIYIVRNPLDLAISLSEFKNRSVDEMIEVLNEKGRVLERPARGSYELSGSWSEHVESWTHRPHARLLTLRYEDMLDEPAQAFASVVSFLKMQANEEAVGRGIEQTSFSALKAVEETLGFNERPKDTKAFFRSGQQGQWRDVLTDRQIARIASANERQMRRFRYWEPEFDDLVSRVRAEDASASMP